MAFLGTHEKFGYSRPGCGFQRYVRTEKIPEVTELNLAHGLEERSILSQVTCDSVLCLVLYFACATSIGSITWVCHSNWRILPDGGEKTGSHAGLMKPHMSWDSILFLLLSALPTPLSQTLGSWDGGYSEPHLRWAREWGSLGLAVHSSSCTFFFSGRGLSWDRVRPQL